MDILIDANFLNNHFKVVKFEDNIFLYQKQSKQLQSIHEMHDAGNMFDYQHNASGIDPTNAELEFDYDDRLEQL